MIAQINAQLLKLVDVVAVEDMTGGDTLARELLLIKLQLIARSTSNPPPRWCAARAAGCCRPIPRATSSNSPARRLEIGEFIANIGAFGEIIEVVRSGVLGIVAPRNPRLHSRVKLQSRYLGRF